jgi:hypothetical protein
VGRAGGVVQLQIQGIDFMKRRFGRKLFRQIFESNLIQSCSQKLRR